MTSNNRLSSLSTCFLAFIISISSIAQNKSSIIIYPDKAQHIINKHIYGHFAEHLGHCIYGGFYVGENNTKIPNTKGVRNDVIDALKKLKIANLRWPRVGFAYTYHWKDGIRPNATRPKMVNVWWGG